MPDRWQRLPALHATIMAVEVAKNLRATLGERVALISENARAIVERGDAVPAREYLSNLDEVVGASAVLEPLAESVDLLLAPSAARGWRPSASGTRATRSCADRGPPSGCLPATSPPTGHPTGSPWGCRRSRRPSTTGAACVIWPRSKPRSKEDDMDYDYDFVGVCREELRLCGVHEGEAVAILSVDSPDERIGHAAGFLQAAKELGALPYHVRLPARRGKGSGAWEVGASPLAGHPPAMAALKEAALVVDLVFLLFSKEQLEIQASGTRILLAVEPTDVLARLLPTPSCASVSSSPGSCSNRRARCGSSTPTGPT